MRNISKMLLLISLILMGSMNSCQKEKTVELPEFGIEEENLNIQVQIVKVDRFNTYKYGDILTFDISNLSEEAINMHVDYQLRFFVLDGDAWIEVPDKMINMTYEDIILDTSGIRGVAGGKPDVPFTASKYKILAFVSGTMVDSGTEVGAYEFFTLYR